MLIAGGFLIVRGRLTRTDEHKWLFVLILGLVAATESLAPDARFPYAMHTVAIALTAHLIGFGPALLTSLVSALIAIFAYPTFGEAIVFAVQCLIVATVVPMSKRYASRLPKVAALLFAVAISQAAAVGAANALGLHGGNSLASWVTVPANTFGLWLLYLVIEDAKKRESAEQLRHAADVARMQAAEANLSSLRSRLQPHFLFNSLTSIAGLCTISADRASAAIVRLAHFMRRAMEQDLGNPSNLAVELNTAIEYLSIERDRFGERVSYSIDSKAPDGAILPAYSIQVLVENAVLHGITARPSGGSICVRCREWRDGIVVSVSDDGVGFTDRRPDLRPNHGLGMLDHQLRLCFGSRSRLRLISRIGGGVLATFYVPRAVELAA